MLVSQKLVAEKIASFLHNTITLGQLVDWAEIAMMEGEFEEGAMPTLREVIARLGVADVRTFGLTWEDCTQALKELGYSAHLDIVRV